MTDSVPAFVHTSRAEPSSPPLPADWREQLAVQLGTRPRRIGLWAEMALFGLRQCLDANGVDRLPAHAVLRVSSAMGPVEALAVVGRSCQAGILPMPFNFLQSQPSQMLAALSLHLQWRGDASFVALNDWPKLMVQGRLEADVLRNRAVQARQPWAGLLMGRVDLGPVPTSEWYWMT